MLGERALTRQPLTASLVACRRHARKRLQPLEFKISTKGHGAILYCFLKFSEPRYWGHTTRQMVDPIVDIIPVSAHGIDLFILKFNLQYTEKWEFNLGNLIGWHTYGLPQF